MIIAAARIASTYTTFSETIDEPVHFGASLQIFARHQYSVQRLNPPVPRLAFGLLPWLDGTTFDRIDPVYGNLGAVFRSPRGYRRTLALARSGNLFFFIIGAVAVWMWAKREIGDAGALAAIFLFTTQPIILGYAGLVTHDTAAIGGVALAVVALLRWIDRPTPPSAMLLGAAYGFGVACKFSCIPFTAAACAAILAVRILWSRDARNRWRPMLATIALVPIIASAVVWASYGFTIHPFVDGLRQMIAINKDMTESYFYMETSNTGFFWYFPAALLLKTTIAFLMFVAAALFAREKRGVTECFAAVAAMLAISMTSPLDLGVRYVLPVFAPLSVAAGAGLVAMWERRRAAAVVLIAWQLLASIGAHPDYFPYFNELAGRDPSLFLIDSNLDWGQDMMRLSAELRKRNVSHVGIALFTTADLGAFGFPPWHRLNAWVPERGWIAVSNHAYRMERTRGGWSWLRHEPYYLVGKSIRLYELTGARR